MKLLIVRNDKIGDFMLAWPAIAQLKRAMPKAEITALVPAYTAPLAQLNTNIDKLIIDPGKDAAKAAQQQLLNEIKQAKFDAMLTLFSTSRVGLMGWRAGIAYRLAPATKMAQLFYTERLQQRRSRSEKPEFEYNQDLIRYFLQQQNQAVKEVEAPYLHFKRETLEPVLTQLLSEAKLSNRPNRMVMVHTGSGGSANNLSIAQYVQLIAELAGLQPDWHFVLTAGPGELEATQKVAVALEQAGVKHHIYHSDAGLKHFCKVIACADLFIAGSTGPLHIAGALNVPTVGFYPRKRSATPLRWQTLSEQRLAFTPPEQGEQDDMSLIDIKQSVVEIKDFSE